MNTHQSPSLIAVSRSRIRRTLVVLLISLAFIGPPLIFPQLRSIYAPLHDSVFLWIIGNVWYRWLPYSMLILAPLGFLLSCLWLAWILQGRFMNRIHLVFTTVYIRLFPKGGLYGRLKTLQVYWIYAISTFPGKYRQRFPFKYTRPQYDTAMVSKYYLTVATGIVARWINTYWQDPDGTHALPLKHRIIETQVGLAALYVPTVRCLDVITTHNIEMAITHLDNAQIFSPHHWHTLQELFRVYVYKHEGVKADHLTLHKIKAMLEREFSVDKTILVRMLINLWFEYRNPTVAAVVTGYAGSHLDRVYRLFHHILDRRHEDVMPAELSRINPLDFRNFYRRYVHFIEASRGNAAAIHTRDLLDNLSRKAEQINAVFHTDRCVDPSLSLYFNTHPDIQSLTRLLAAEFHGLLTISDFQQQANAWAEQSKILHVFQQPARDAGWSTLYRTGDMHAFSRMIENEKQTSDISP